MQKGTLFVLISNSSLVCGEYFVVIVDIVFKFNYMMATQCSIMEDAHIMVIVTHKLRFICLKLIISPVVVMDIISLDHCSRCRLR